MLPLLRDRLQIGLFSGTCSMQCKSFVLEYQPGLSYPMSMEDLRAELLVVLDHMLTAQRVQLKKGMGVTLTVTDMCAALIT